ncbi:MAG: PAS domain-containing protein [Proteobacteria bacterium]|nr:PAS domain-containing protein [Pseudomonadota bacterium]
MNNNNSDRIVNIGLVGGGPYCVEVLDKYVLGASITIHNTRIVAIADRESNSPGIVKAQELGIKTFEDYHDLYDPRYSIQLIIVLTEEDGILEDIIGTRPYRIRILSFEVFKFLWKDIGVVEDELDKREEELYKRSREMETILNHIQDFIVVITPDLEIVEANQAFLDYMDHTREEVVGRKCYEILYKKSHFCDICNTDCPLNEVIRNKLPSHRVGHVQIARDGKPRYLDDVIHPIWEKDGQISRFIKIGRDITELKDEQEKITLNLEKLVKKRTKELQDTNAILLHQDKMSSLGKLSAAVVHEINNPIAGILNLTMLMKRINQEESLSKTESKEFDNYLTLMETETRRISRIVSNLLAFSRQSSEEPDRLDFNELIEKTLVMNSNLIKINNIQITKKLATQLPRLLGAEDPLQQVLVNLMSNAIEAMETTEEKRLTIETRYSLAENRIYVSFMDTGIGIPEEHFLKLYEPFFTTKKKGKGVGLGLSMVYGIIEKHHGKITIESNLNKGTTFQISLPVDRVADETETAER